MRYKIYLYSKKEFILFLILWLIAIPLLAQEKTEVLLKFSKKEGLLRIVLEAEEAFLNKSKATVSSSQIKVEFPELFNLATKTDVPFEVVPEDRSLVINLKEESEIKLFRLSSPARYVFDIQMRSDQAAQSTSRLFVLDPGHGGYDFGITLEDAKEKDISLGLAKDLRTYLSKKGKKVYLTRNADIYMPLLERIKFINQKAPDVFISFHSSLSDKYVISIAKFGDEGTGELVERYSLSSRQKKYIGKSRALSGNIGEAIKNNFKKNVIYREMPLPLLNSVSAPSVLIEIPSPRFLVYDQELKTKLIKAILDGLAAHAQ